MIVSWNRVGRFQHAAVVVSAAAATVSNNSELFLPSLSIRSPFRKVPRIPVPTRMYLLEAGRGERAAGLSALASRPGPGENLTGCTNVTAARAGAAGHKAPMLLKIVHQ